MRWQKAYFEIIAGDRQGMVARVIRGALRPAAWMYQYVTACRNFCFHTGLRQSTRVEVPVISVGNLTTGGTGKTPIVACVVEQLLKLKRQPGIVSRGYHADATGINDEKRVLEHLCPGVIHLQNPNRVTASVQLIKEHDVDVVVLDDGFQHRQIARDLDVVLIDATNPFGYEFVLPRGLLREPLQGLQRAHMIVVTRCDQVPAAQLEMIEDQICGAAPQHKDRLARVSFRPVGFLSAGGEKIPLSQIEAKRVMFVTAIGNPQAFEDTCRRLGADIVCSRLFPDHHHYSQSDLGSILSDAAKHRVKTVLTTLKDLVKIQRVRDDRNHEQEIPILALEIATVFDSTKGEELLHSVLQEVLS
ncbi:MAG: tetraacyldisaccharide 4'-kinase [Fuerstiella sp.]|nr:tetraacyldisaccharide 4'-kinase [Fuerstiella sp.]